MTDCRVSATRPAASPRDLTDTQSDACVFHRSYAAGLRSLYFLYSDRRVCLVVRVTGRAGRRAAVRPAGASAAALIPVPRAGASAGPATQAPRVGALGAKHQGSSRVLAGVMPNPGRDEASNAAPVLDQGWEEYLAQIETLEGRRAHRECRRRPALRRPEKH